MMIMMMMMDDDGVDDDVDDGRCREHCIRTHNIHKTDRIYRNKSEYSALNLADKSSSTI